MSALHIPYTWSYTFSLRKGEGRWRLKGRGQKTGALIISQNESGNSVCRSRLSSQEAEELKVGQKEEECGKRHYRDMHCHINAL